MLRQHEKGSGYNAGEGTDMEEDVGAHNGPEQLRLRPRHFLQVVRRRRRHLRLRPKVRMPSPTGLGSVGELSEQLQDVLESSVLGNMRKFTASHAFFKNLTQNSWIPSFLQFSKSAFCFLILTSAFLEIGSWLDQVQLVVREERL